MAAAERDPAVNRSALWDLLTSSDLEARRQGFLLAGDVLGSEAPSFIARASRFRHLQDLETQLTSATDGSVAAAQFTAQISRLLGLDQPQQANDPTPEELACPQTHREHLLDLLQAARLARLLATRAGRHNAVPRLLEIEMELAEKIRAGDGGGASRADRLGRLANRARKAVRGG